MKHDVTIGYGSTPAKERKVLGQAETKEDVYRIMKETLDKAKYKSYYYNITLNGDANEWRIDFGSWSYFFFVSADINLLASDEPIKDDEEEVE